MNKKLQLIFEFFIALPDETFLEKRLQFFKTLLMWEP